MTYDEYKKKMIEYCEARNCAWENNDMETDDEIERAMLKLEKENPEFADRWCEDLSKEFIENYKVISELKMIWHSLT
jgi:hypothetical protein